VQISRAIDRLRTEAGNPNRCLYDNNKAVYSLLRYGVPVKAAVDENTETVWLINWENPAQNDYAIAEEGRCRATTTGGLIWCFTSTASPWACWS
jgi:type I restriction enzyme, R subunit